MLRPAQSDTWLTPPWLIEALGPFDLDPCASPDMPWRTAKEMYTHELDGLMLPWLGRVWLNPPYSLPHLRSFLEKLSVHNHGTALVFAKTETAVFFDCIWNGATALLFLRGRINFHREDGTVSDDDGGCGSVLAAYGRDDADILSAVPINGAFIPLRLPRAWLIGKTVGSWRDELEKFFDRHEGPVTLGQLYAFFASHPKTESNRFYQEKIRQVLQKGRFHRVRPGVWERRPVKEVV